MNAFGAELGAELKHSWPQYAAYAVSFLIIGSWWVNHHADVAVIDRVDRTLLFGTIPILATGLPAAVSSVFPIPTPSALTRFLLPT